MQYLFAHLNRSSIIACHFFERLKEGCVWADASLEDLHDDIHAEGLYLEHSLPEPLHEAFEQLALLHLDVLQGVYVLLMMN